jgi:hypothetical protein
MLSVSKGSLRHLDDLIVGGFGQYNPGATITVKQCQVGGFRNRWGERFLVLNTGIVAGMSGGPVVTPNGKVAGIAVTGAGREHELEDGDFEHGAIPIELLTAQRNAFALTQP